MIGTHGKLTEDRAEVIRLLWSNGEHTQGQIAELCYDIWGIEISRAMINHVVNNNRWNKDIRSFEMKEQQKKSNDYREFYNPHKPKILTKEHVEDIQRRLNILNQYLSE